MDGVASAEPLSCCGRATVCSATANMSPTFCTDCRTHTGRACALLYGCVVARSSRVHGDTVRTTSTSEEFTDHSVRLPRMSCRASCGDPATRSQPLTHFRLWPAPAPVPAPAVAGPELAALPVEVLVVEPVEGTWRSQNSMPSAWEMASQPSAWDTDTTLQRSLCSVQGRRECHQP